MRPDLFRRLEPRRIVDGGSNREPHDRADPGVDINSWALASWRAMVRTRRSKPLNSRNSTAWAASNASATTSKVGCPATSSLIRAANRLDVVAPTFSPKPRKVPRRLASISRSFDCTSLRAVSSARVSCAVFDLQCTGRNQPSRISCAIPRASLPVRLHRHRLECVTHVPRLQQLDRKAGCPHPRIQPLRKRPGLQADPHQAQTCRPEPRNQRLRLARHLPLPHDLPVRIHNANTRAFQ